MILSAASADVSSATEGHLHTVNCITHGSSRIQEIVINEQMISTASDSVQMVGATQSQRARETQCSTPVAIQSQLLTLAQT